MELTSFLTCLGKPVGDAGLAAALPSWGVWDPSTLRLESGEYSAYATSKRSGFSLIFTDEAMFLGSPGQSVGEGPLYFTGVFLYAGGEHGYARFGGPLPLGLSFDVDHGALLGQLGEPSWSANSSDGVPRLARWDDLAPYRVHVTFDRATLRPSVLSLHVPNAQP